MKKPLAILLLLFSFVSAQKTIAVIEFEAKGISQIEASALSDELEMHLTNRGGYTLVERGKVEEVLQEQGFQQTGCTSDECAVEVGMLLSVQNIVIGSISKVGSTYSVNAKIVDVETGEIIKTASYKFRGLIDDLLVSGMAEVASELMGKGVQRTEVVISTPSPPRKRVGSISINTEPKEAFVKVDGESYKLSPITVENLSPGNHLVEVSKVGFVTSSKTVEVIIDEVTNVDLELPIKTGNIDLRSIEPAKYVIENQSGEFRQEGQTSILLSLIPTGSYELLIEKKDHLTLVNNISVDYQKTTNLNLAMLSIDYLKENIEWLQKYRSYGLIISGLLIGGSFYLKYEANENYRTYSQATLEATDLHNNIEMLDNSVPIVFTGGIIPWLFLVDVQSRIFKYSKWLETGKVNVRNQVWYEKELKRLKLRK